MRLVVPPCMPHAIGGIASPAAAGDSHVFRGENAGRIEPPGRRRKLNTGRAAAKRAATSDSRAG